LFKPQKTGNLRKLCKKKLRVLYSLPNIIQVVKPRTMRWEAHILHTGEEKRNRNRGFVGKTVVKRPLIKYYWDDEINRN